MKVSYAHFGIFLFTVSYTMPILAPPPTTSDIDIASILYAHFGHQRVNPIIAEMLKLGTIPSQKTDVFVTTPMLNELCYQIALHKDMCYTTLLADTLAEIDQPPAPTDSTEVITQRARNKKIADENLPYVMVSMDEIKRLGLRLAWNYKKLLAVTIQIPINLPSLTARILDEIHRACIVFERFLDNRFNTPARAEFFKKHYNGCLEPWHILDEELTNRLPPD